MYLKMCICIHMSTCVYIHLCVYVYSEKYNTTRCNTTQHKSMVIPIIWFSHLYFLPFLLLWKHRLCKWSGNREPGFHTHRVPSRYSLSIEQEKYVHTHVQIAKMTPLTNFISSYLVFSFVTFFMSVLSSNIWCSMLVEWLWNEKLNFRTVDQPWNLTIFRNGFQKLFFSGWRFWDFQKSISENCQISGLIHSSKIEFFVSQPL